MRSCFTLSEQFAFSRIRALAVLHSNPARLVFSPLGYFRHLILSPLCTSLLCRNRVCCSTHVRLQRYACDHPPLFPSVSLVRKGGLAGLHSSLARAYFRHFVLLRLGSFATWCTFLLCRSGARRSSHKRLQIYPRVFSPFQTFAFYLSPLGTFLLHRNGACRTSHVR